MFLAAMAVILLLTILGMIGRAAADNGASSDPVDLLTRLYEFMRTGKGTMAVGVANLLVVWLARTVLSKKIAWFGTMVGGYVLGFGTAVLEYLGIGITTTGMFTFGMLANAIGAGFVASGGWEAFRDILTKSNRKVVGVTTAAILFLTALPGCGTGPGPVIANAVIDCAKVNQDELTSLVTEFTPIVFSGSVDWDKVKAKAKLSGLDMAGCVIGELVNAYLSNRKSSDNGDGWKARQYFESFRSRELNNATVKTRDGKNL